MVVRGGFSQNPKPVNFEFPEKFEFSFLCGLLVFFTLILFGISPFEVFESIIYGSLGSYSKFIRTIIVWTPISLASLALIIPFLLVCGI